MNWDMIDKCEILFDSHNIKPVLGVIPNNQDSDLKLYPSNEKFWDRIRAWKQKGWEISIHGYSHVYGEATKKKATEIRRRISRKSEIIMVKP